MGCTTSTTAIKETTKPSGFPPTPHPRGTSRTGTPFPNNNDDETTLKESNSTTNTLIGNNGEVKSSAPSPTEITFLSTSSPTPTTHHHPPPRSATPPPPSTVTDVPGAGGGGDDGHVGNFALKAIKDTNRHAKEEEDAFQPTPGYVVKLKSLNPTYQYDKIFLNIFHHFSYNIYPKEFILSKEQFIIYDHQQKECLVYNILLATITYEHLEANPTEKNETLVKLISSINQKYPLVKLDDTNIKFPHTTKGYVGNEIPFFIIPGPNRRSSVRSSITAAGNIPFVTETQENGMAMASTPATHHAHTDSSTVVNHEVTSPAPSSRPHTPQHHLLATPPVETPIVPPPVEELPTLSSHPSTPLNEAATPILNAPPKMLGWLRKRGHVVQNWKTRYFVLDNGFLTYYVDKSDNPPYGKTMKGQLCLAGYRDAAVVVNGKINEEKLKEYETQRSSLQSEASDLGKLPKNRRKSSGMFTSEPQLRIHLVYVKGIVNEGNIDDLRSTFNQQNNTKSDEEGNGGIVYEFMMEASSLEEKYAWLAALDAHTSYIESVANSDTFNLEKFPLDNEEDSTPIDRHLSVTPFNTPNTKNLLNSALKDQQQAEEEKQSQQTPASVRPESERVKRPSMTESPVAAIPMNANGGGGGGRRVSVMSTSAINQKWKIFVERGEEFVAAGLTGKPNPVGIQLIREIILVKAPPTIPNDSLPPMAPTKRIIYVDANSFEYKGEIKWIQGEQHPVLRKVNDDAFDLKYKGRSYRFFPKDEKTVDDWINLINSIPPHPSKDILL